jgi:hypothetical protein
VGQVPVTLPSVPDGNGMSEEHVGPGPYAWAECGSPPASIGYLANLTSLATGDKRADLGQVEVEVGEKGLWAAGEFLSLKS